jgi:hypothetical protein
MGGVRVSGHASGNARAGAPAHEVADACAQIGATDGEIVTALVRECGLARPMAAAWVKANGENLDEARVYGCLQLRRWLNSIAQPPAEVEEGQADPGRCTTQSLKATEILARHRLGMTLEGAMDKVVRGTGGKPAQHRVA